MVIDIWIDNPFDLNWSIFVFILEFSYDFLFLLINLLLTENHPSACDSHIRLFKISLVHQILDVFFLLLQIVVLLNEIVNDFIFVGKWNVEGGKMLMTYLQFFEMLFDVVGVDQLVINIAFLVRSTN